MLDKNSSILITGGTGSFGKKFVETILSDYPDVKRIVVFSRDELKQYEMAQQFPTDKYPQMRYFLGDIRDKERLYRAFEGIDTVIHAAALKQVPAAEYNPMEFVKTNVIGAENIVNAAIDKGVKRVVALSTDKAAAPVNLYGATKLCSDKIFVAANNLAGGHDIRFSVVRYGNVMGSRGSVIPFFLKKRKEGVLPITHEEMTRFNISLQDGVQLVMKALENAWGGEIFVPKIPSYKVVDVAKAIGPNCELQFNGLRPGEKVHEEMITASDSYYTVDMGDHFAILPQSPRWEQQELLDRLGGTPVEQGFKYNSGENDEWLSVEQIREQIRIHVDPDFEV